MRHFSININLILDNINNNNNDDEEIIRKERVYNNDNTTFTTLCIDELKSKFWIYLIVSTLISLDDSMTVRNAYEGEAKELA